MEISLVCVCGRGVKIRPFRYGNNTSINCKSSSGIALKSDRFGMEMLDILMLCFLMNLLKSDRFGMEISFHSPRALNKDSLKVKIRPFRYGNCKNSLTSSSLTFPRVKIRPPEG